ncbi:MAG: hypothetical protein JSS61_01520 [Verrucomicrobia bacterium]|nr:hypothetical protein [Verrucomicrobiota bacterium]
MGKRSLLLFALIPLYALLIYRATHPALPSPDRPLLFYSNQTRHDLKLTFCQALRQAKKSASLSVYGITDPEILDLLGRRGAEGLPIEITYDPSASSPDVKKLPATLIAKQSKGLMHRKILLFDDEMAFLGSANLTPPSLKHHDNLVLGIHHAGLSHFLRDPPSCHYAFQLGKVDAALFLLPDPIGEGYDRLLSLLYTAQKTIQVALFTFTHPKIAEALIAAKERGVEVRVALDTYTAKGASRKIAERLKEAGIPLLTSQGQKLLHHKWALIDGSTLVMGSANWTKAAFSKNSDFLLILSHLSPSHQNYMSHLWEIIEIESEEVYK